MEWNNPYKTMKEVEAKATMDMTITPNMDQIEYAVGSSDKEISAQMKLRKKSMTSLYLKFFETAADGKSRKCKFCKQSYSISTATGNLRRHLNHHHPGYDRQDDVAQLLPRDSSTTFPTKKIVQSQAKPATAVDFDHLNLMLIRWLTEASLPPSTLEDKALLMSLRLLNPAVKLWPRDRTQSTMSSIFRSMRDDVIASMQNLSSKISISLEFWKSSEQTFFMGIKGFWIDENWAIRRVLLDVYRISFPCEGQEIFSAMSNVLKAFNLEKSILACTLDCSRDVGQPAVNACLALREELDAQKTVFCHVPCAAQALNLIIEDGLKPLRTTLMKIREVVHEINSSPLIGQDFQQLTTGCQEGIWQLPVDASACWTGDYAMLDIARKAPNSIEMLTRKHEQVLGGKSQLLTTTEKSLVNFLHSNFEPFYKITANLSSCKLPTVGLVLFFMDHVFEIITAFRENCRHEWLKSAAADMAERARSFSLTANNTLAFMAAVLDPRIKKDLIPDNLNSEKNIDEMRNFFLKNYSGPPRFPSLANGYPAQEDELTSSVSFAEEIARKRRRQSIATAVTDELTQYLAEPPVPIATDVLEWWRVNSMRYPRLSVMARDYLAVQGTCVEPENLFSGKGDELQRRRFCLPPSSMRTVLCIQSWVESGYKFKFRSKEVDF